MILRALAVLVVLIAAEILHGIVRGVLLVPQVGQIRYNQIGVFILLSDENRSSPMPDRLTAASSPRTRGC